jgi:hypothetical protein
LISPKQIDDDILPMHVEKATDTILQSVYGLHALIIYSDMATLREFWSFYTKKSIEESNELVCLTPFYDTVDSVRKTLSEEGHMSIDVQKYETNPKSLIIADSYERYFDKTGRALQKELVLKEDQRLEGLAKELNKKGVSILGDMGVFLFKNLVQNLVDYELAFSKQPDTKLKNVCLYHQKDFDRLSVNQKEEIVGDHKIAIRIG